MGNDGCLDFTDPVFFFITDWFPIYLTAKGVELKSGLIAIWAPSLQPILGAFQVEEYQATLIKRGWSVCVARKAVVIFGGIEAKAIIPTIFTNRLSVIALLFGFATFSYSAFSTMANVLPSDLFCK
jgi:ACS family hexuronate transporter-like MFS transporter